MKMLRNDYWTLKSKRWMYFIPAGALGRNAPRCLFFATQPITEFSACGFPQYYVSGILLEAICFWDGTTCQCLQTATAEELVPCIILGKISFD
mmetsp:Transcript_32536/g.67996  ORF Transcript_32536/g.67996 Transcript_32536/m.67996 type:complete len:93 (-) Transcript_32536:220-498(-)